MLRLLRAALAGCCLVGAAACDDYNAPPANYPNTEGTVRLYAFNSAPPTAAVGLLLADPSTTRPVGMRLSPLFLFDFAVEFDGAGTPFAYPIKLIASNLATQREVGFQRFEVDGVPVPFDSVKLAPTSTAGYAYGTPYELAVGDVIVIDSNSPPMCPRGFTPRMFAKVRVEAVDPVARSVDFKVLSNPNCGFRGLETGTPRE
jgi:hypothetical protein